MKGDVSRDTFDRRNHFRTVRQQQGRVQLDADWNEQADLAAHRAEAAAADLIGGCGGPLHAAAFHVVTPFTPLSAEEQAYPGNAPLPALAAGQLDFTLTAGRYYANGVLCESEQAVAFATQPYLPGAGKLSAAGTYLIYLDVWARHVSVVEKPSLRESALGGPDTATREEVVWQVKAMTAPTGANCQTVVPEFTALTAPTTGTLAARTRTDAPDPDPCAVPPGAGYRGLENQLYRVEVHDPGAAHDVTAAPNTVIASALPQADQVRFAAALPAAWAVGDPVEVFASKTGADPMLGGLAYVTAIDATRTTITLDTPVTFSMADQPRVRRLGATFKWSRDNGSVATRVKAHAQAAVTVENVGVDAVLGFAPGQWAELTDDVLELAGKPGRLARIAGVDVASGVVTLATPVAAVDMARNPRLRRWDGAGGVRFLPTGQGWIDLEDRIQVRFGSGGSRTGQFWTIPARTTTSDPSSGKIEWPTSPSGPLALPPAGPRHSYCRLAVVVWSGSAITAAADCRTLFPPATELTALFALGGDGQEADPDLLPDPANRVNIRLAQPLKVGVANGRWAVAGAKVVFTVEQGTGVLGGTPAGEAITQADGTATCTWDVDPVNRVQRVRAELKDATGTRVHLPVWFHANLSLAAEVAYDPAKCADMKAKQIRTVQAALDRLCELTDSRCETPVPPGEDVGKFLVTLLAQGKRDICLCLGPGDYKTATWSVSGPSRVTLKGCGPASRLTFSEAGGTFTGVQSVTLADLAIITTQPTPAFQFEKCAHVAVRGCHLSGVVGVNGMVTFVGDGWASVTQSRFLPNRDLSPLVPTLVLASREADINLTDNVFGGPVSLYGAPGDGFLTGDDFAKLRSREASVSAAGVGVLTATGNQFARVTVGKEFLDRVRALGTPGAVQPPMFRHILFSTNTFTDQPLPNNALAIPSVVVATGLSFTGNVFDSNRLVATTVAAAATFTGNRGVTGATLSCRTNPGANAFAQIGNVLLAVNIV